MFANLLGHSAHKKFCNSIQQNHSPIVGRRHPIYSIKRAQSRSPPEDSFHDYFQAVWCFVVIIPWYWSVILVFVCLQCFTEAELEDHHKGILFIIFKTERLTAVYWFKSPADKIQSFSTFLNQKIKNRSWQEQDEFTWRDFISWKTYQQLFRLGRYNIHQMQGENVIKSSQQYLNCRRPTNSKDSSYESPAKDKVQYKWLRLLGHTVKTHYNSVGWSM